MADGGHRISGVDVSESRSQALRSTPQRYDEADWLDIFHPDTFETYGHGIYLKRTSGASVTGVIARGGQNGIGLFESRDAIVADNDVAGNSGWGIHLWRSSRNTIIRNNASSQRPLRESRPIVTGATARGCCSGSAATRISSPTTTSPGRATVSS